MTPEERNQLRADVVKAVNETLAEQQRELRSQTWPDEETRIAHHRFIAEWIKEKKTKRQNWQRIKGNLVVAAVTAVFAGVGSLGLWILQELRDRGVGS